MATAYRAVLCINGRVDGRREFFERRAAEETVRRWSGCLFEGGRGSGWVEEYEAPPATMVTGGTMTLKNGPTLPILGATLRWMPSH